MVRVKCRENDINCEKQVVNPAYRKNFFCWLVGGLILFANKGRHSVEGYLTPRTFPITDFTRGIDYDLDVIASWRHFLDEYMGEETSLKGKSILELGPGADLGIGLLLLAYGAEKYSSLDVNNLVATVPAEFYEQLFSRIEKAPFLHADIEELRVQLEFTVSGRNRRLNYVHDPEFDLMQFAKDDVDIIFSQAAFEHFDDVQETFLQLTKIVRPGAVLVAEIDLSTHTRWIRDFDPLNIYRYSDLYYRLMSFPGSPNRVRPHQYRRYLEELGWKDVRIVPKRVADSQYVARISNHIAKEFQNPRDEVGNLSVILCATR